MINLTPNQIELIPAREKIQMPELDMATLVGGWLSTQSELRKGNVNIQANKERILFGSATDPTTGVGIFIGKDGADYEFRVGDPSGNNLLYDGTNITITGGNISAGSITIGTDAWHVDSSGNMWWGAFATYADASIRISSLGAIESSSIKTAGSGTRTEIGITALSQIDFYSSSGHKSSLLGLDNELRIRMEQAGGYVTIYAQNDGDNPVEVARFDGNAGFSMLENRLDTKLAKTNIVILSGVGKIALEIANIGTANSLLINQTLVTNSNILLQCDNAGTGQVANFFISNANSDAHSLLASSAGTGYSALFTSIDNASRTKATVYIGANTGRGAHIYFAPIATAPASPSVGDLYADTDGKLYYYNGAWKEIAFVP